ncbi:MAG: recombination protein RecR [Candidatus Staskawiczbacteria bacterium RIFOXYC1_FULL_37_43]|nr:MAG: recombination protein RecR [Candidatus Staskawiczbacteria bacterium RIFCSPHIGHO2_01_FULL_37_17]OGZ72490.1 MAG: recombination protein RecR [Candidatus Staskawiczbacteria bacterium RIFCSPLOWO2_01_FULL_37_19]OGZ75657.1 MAG: recombination protein RecR [Candidatus Staskawiczbacteria bacterium RIFOXYA1_FULL_37_15]OGZ77421.1 MAG: recombination protein RecR [Candidatus Staskawiczbacteria bacterium RIFOXYA12_FULL_37_10]OGZ79934.1 MAG: recombination protein RecR [Candidatus Staskawiczbacteria bac
MSSIDKLIDIFKKFPTVGPRTARRFVYYLIKLPKNQIDELSRALEELKNNVKLCQLCFNPFEDSGGPSSADLCEICSDLRRNKNLLCIVEKEADLLSIENTKKYNGLYFILGGTLAMMRKEDIDNLRIEPLKERIKTGNFSEIIIALNPTPEGKATSMLIERMLKESFGAAQDLKQSFKITHLAKGIPVGGELEYADEETLESAFEGRK